MSDPHQTPVCMCPACGYVLDCTFNATPGRTQRPVPGDVTLCLSCAVVLVFEPNMTLSRMTDEDIATISPDMAAYLIRWQMLIRTASPVKDDPGILGHA